MAQAKYEGSVFSKRATSPQTRWHDLLPAHNALIVLLKPVHRGLAAPYRSHWAGDDLFVYDLDYYDWDLRFALMNTQREGVLEIRAYLRPKSLRPRIAAKILKAKERGFVQVHRSFIGPPAGRAPWLEWNAVLEIALNGLTHALWQRNDVQRIVFPIHRAS